MTDITELAQSLKAAAENAGADYWQEKKIRGDFYVIRKGSYKRECGYLTYQPIAEIDHKPTRDYMAMASPANILALVEALEKAQTINAAQDDHINHQQDRIDQLEKGHQEAAKQINSWRRMAKQNIAEREKDIAELDAARQRIAELETRTVTVKLPPAVSVADWMVDIDVYEADLLRALLTAAGIKVEAE